MSENESKGISAIGLLFIAIFSIVILYNYYQPTEEKSVDIEEKNTLTLENIEEEEKEKKDTKKKHPPKKVIEFNSNKPIESKFFGSLIINRVQTNNEFNPEKEFLILKSQSNLPINISNWIIKSFINENYVSIPQAEANINGKEQDIILKKYNKVYLYSGKSPIRDEQNFRETICTGFITKDLDNKNFKKTCPEFKIDILDRKKYSPECINILENLKKCQIISFGDFRTSDQFDCYERAAPYVNYESCVRKFKDQENFSLKIWHVYLDLDKNFWEKKNDILTIFDGNNLLVNTYKY